MPLTALLPLLLLLLQVARAVSFPEAIALDTAAARTSVDGRGSSVLGPRASATCGNDSAFVGGIITLPAPPGACPAVGEPAYMHFRASVTEGTLVISDASAGATAPPALRYANYPPQADPSLISLGGGSVNVSAMRGLEIGPAPPPAAPVAPLTPLFRLSQGTPVPVGSVLTAADSEGRGIWALLPPGGGGGGDGGDNTTAIGAARRLCALPWPPGLEAPPACDDANPCTVTPCYLTACLGQYPKVNGIACNNGTHDGACVRGRCVVASPPPPPP